MTDPARPLADVECAECGYDLRGLLPYGNCPECGTAIYFSLDETAMKRLEKADPRWVRTLAYGGAFGVGAFALILVLVLAPAGWYLARGRSLSAIAIAAWICVWASAFLLGRREPDDLDRAERRLPLVLRLTASAYAFAPLMTYVVPDEVEVITFAVVLLPVLLSGIVAAPCFFVRLGQLAARQRAELLPVECKLLAILCVPLTCLAPELRGRAPDILGDLLTRPYLIFGAPAIPRTLRNRLLDWQLPNPWYIMLTLLMLWAGAVLVRATHLLWHAARRAESVNID